MNIIVRKLPCKLSDQEKLRTGQQVGQKVKELGSVQSDKKETASMFKAREEAIQADISRLGRMLETGEEDRDVECDQIFNWGEGVVELIRTDTGVLIDTRHITPQERQTRMPI